MKTSISSTLLIFLVMISSAPAMVCEKVYDAEPLFNPFSHVILFSWDGVQYNHLMELYDSDQLPSLKQMVNETRLPILRALITDHYTETNYGHPSLLSGKGQGTTQGCPDNITIWENIETWDNSWVAGSIAGKAKFSTQIFPYAKDDVDYWYAQDVNAGTVTALATEFIQNYTASSFFLFIHYRDPDLAAHTYGENSLQYENAIITCDNQMGTILSTLETQGILDSTAILVTTDHGFLEGGTSHSGSAWGSAGADPDKYTIWIASNAGEVGLNEAADEFWDQNDAASTVYSLIGLSDYGSRWPYIRGSALWDRAFDVRDVAVTDVQLSKTVISSGNLYINVSIENQGNYTEIPTISIYYNDTPIASKTLAYPDTPLFGYNRDSSHRKITFTWNTESIPKGTYVITVNASTIPANGLFQPNMAYTKNETDLTDNTFTDGTVKVTIPGDINGDFYVNITDATQIGLHWMQLVPPAPANVDINGDSIINVKDATIIGTNWLEHA